MIPVSAGSAEEERIVPGTPTWEASFPDHIQRYRFALHYVREGASVLDAGCGVGYGAAEVADRRSARVVAVDISEEALRLARQHFDRPAITWCRDDCQTLQEAAAHAPFDAIINFENIEHLADPEAFVRRSAALLQPEGVLLTSTPNRLLLNKLRGTHPDSRSSNPYHLNELSESEFRALLRRHFHHVEIRYQSPTGSARMRLLLRSAASTLRLLPLARAVVRLLRRVRPPTTESAPGSGAGRAWVIEEEDRGAAWTIIGICRRPRVAEASPVPRP